MRRFLALIIILPFILGPICFAGEDTGGNHTGELNNLNIVVRYQGYYYIYDGLPVYYPTSTMRFEVILKNNSERTFNSLSVKTVQEYHESGICDRWWYPYPRYVEYTKGEVLPGSSVRCWTNITLRDNQSIVLPSYYYIPLPVCWAIAQTHVIVKHMNNGQEEAAVIYDNPECGLFYP